MLKHRDCRAISGFSVVELMIVVAILAIISLIAIPAYQGYIREAQLSTARANVDSLRLFLEDWRLDNNTYQVDGSDFDPKATPALGWQPDGDQNLYTYEVVGATSTNYTVTITYDPNGRWLRCEDRMRTCCDGMGAVTACP
jgi:type IV pilus assembly protein PilE